MSDTVSTLPATSSLPGTGANSESAPLLKATQLHARASATFDAKLAETRALLTQAAADFTQPDGTVRITQASSLGAEDVVVSHLIASLNLGIPVFVLETGALHTETLQLLEQTVATRKAPVHVYTPKSDAVAAFLAKHGAEAMYRSIDLRKACCQIRKMEPLARALAGHQAWITGLRREQSGARADVPLIDTSELQANPGSPDSRTKFNPLANWTWGDVWHYIKLHNVAYNPLHDRFFPSIGCAPCTRAIALGEDFRAGRWWWEAALEGGAAKECGLHVKHTPEGATA
jgi:phosphoadenosine phosphosulfate reductase